ncbi:MAG: type II secretion system F family protein [Lachnospiraceae bacterium]|nr:type II secretion system F family protein [Lachnospiraceae bacterium]
MEKKATKKSLSNIELSSFSSQMAMILKSGISSIEGVTIMLTDSTTEEEKAILNDISTTLTETGSFYKALVSSSVFPKYFLHMVEIGEQTGKLDEVMDALSSHYSREESISKTVRNAVTYPLIMVGMMILVILVLVIKVMPVFNQVFIQLGRELNGFSRGIMTLGATINRYSIAFTILFLLIIGCILYLTKTKSGRRTFLTLGYKFKGSRIIYEEIAACRFASGMALTLSSGLNPEQSIELINRLIENDIFQKKVQTCEALMKQGATFEAALSETHIFNGVYARMASIGSKTGTLDEVMDKIAVQYEEDIDTKINNILAVLEPTLVISLSVIVGIILLSVMLPLMGIMSGL